MCSGAGGCWRCAGLSRRERRGCVACGCVACAVSLDAPAGRGSGVSSGSDGTAPVPPAARAQRAPRAPAAAAGRGRDVLCSAELWVSLEEHQDALELIMSKYRKQMLQLLEGRKREEAEPVLKVHQANSGVRWDGDRRVLETPVLCLLSGNLCFHSCDVCAPKYIISESCLCWYFPPFLSEHTGCNSCPRGH